jgi:hypothetical protein
MLIVDTMLKKRLRSASAQPLGAGVPPAENRSFVITLSVRAKE